MKIRSGASPMRLIGVAFGLGLSLAPGLAFAEKAFLEITLKIDAADRPAAGKVYAEFKQPFLTTVPGATSKDLLIRTEDVQVLHGFKGKAEAEAYLTSKLFTADIVTRLKPLLKAAPEVRIYSAD